MELIDLQLELAPAIPINMVSGVARMHSDLLSLPAGSATMAACRLRNSLLVAESSAVRLITTVRFLHLVLSDSELWQQGIHRRLQ